MRKIYNNFFYWMFCKIAQQKYSNDFDGAFGSFCCLSFIIEVHYGLLVVLLKPYDLIIPGFVEVFFVMNLAFNYYMIFYKKKYLKIKEMFKDETEKERKKRSVYCTLYCVSFFAFFLLLACLS